MNTTQAPPTTENWQNYICPDLTAHWQLGKLKDTGEIVLQSKDGSRQLRLSADCGTVLQYCTGKFTAVQVQQRCELELGKGISSNFVFEVLQKLIDLEVIPPPTEPAVAESSPTPAAETTNTPPPPATSPYSLKPCVHWIFHPQGYWILRNPEDVTFLQVDSRSKAAIEDLAYLPPGEVAQKHQIDQNQLRYLLQLLSATAMLIGTTPPPPKPKPWPFGPGKFTPMSLLFFQFSLFNPDPWLSKHIDKLRWIWTGIFGFILCAFIGYSAALGLHEQQSMISAGKRLMQEQGALLLLPFVLLSLLVVTIHELGHAFTLKHYGGIVPDVGMRFMLLMPSAYTNTTDSYCLVKRRQRVLVVGAGIMVQIVIWAIAFWLWNISSAGTWLSITSLLLMAAALFTVAINLNPLSKFDGYYLASALSGINNLRSRSFALYGNLLRFRPIQEKFSDALVLIAYAPFSLAYTIFVFGHLLGFLAEFSLGNIPFLTLTLLGLWAIYFFWPEDKNATNTANSNPPTPMNNLTAPPKSSVKTAPPTNNQKPSEQIVNNNISDQKAPAPKPTPAPPVPKKSYHWQLIIVARLVLVSFVNVPFDVGGTVQLETKEGTRALARAPLPGVIQKILVKPGEQVIKGQTLAYLSSAELEKEIAETQQRLDGTKLQLEDMQRRQAQTKADLARAEAISLSANEKANRYGDRASRMNLGQLPPDIQSLEAQKSRLQSLVRDAEVRDNRRQELARLGAISREDAGKVRTEVESLRNDIRAKEEEINYAKLRLQDHASETQAESYTQKTILIGAQMVRSAQEQISAFEKAIANYEARIKQLKTAKESLILTAPISGIVLTNDLDKKQFKELRPSDEFLLEIADLKQLTAIVEVREEDMKYVEVGKSVTFRPLLDKLRAYNAKVEQILPQVQIDPNQQKKAVLVRIVVDNTDGQLLPKGSGYAKVWSEWIPLYRRIGREVKRLIPIEKFL